MTQLTVASAELSRIVRTVEKSAAKDDSRPVLAGIHAVAQDGKLTLTAADGFRLSTAHAPLDVDTDASAASAILNRVALLAFAKSLKPKVAPTVTIDTDAAAWTFSANGTRAAVSTIAGTYPDVQSIIGTGDEPQLFAVNPKYFADTMASHGEGVVRVSRARDDASAPLFFTADDGTRHVVMPMVIHADAAPTWKRDDAPAPVAEPEPEPVKPEASAFRSVRAARKRVTVKRAARRAGIAPTIAGHCAECGTPALATDNYCAECGTPCGVAALADLADGWPAPANVTPIRPAAVPDALARFSERNRERILSAYPHATDVRGFHQWLAAGRCVMKGQKGVGIIAPNADAGDDDSERVKRVYVFDISQTQVLAANRAV